MARKRKKDKEQNWLARYEVLSGVAGAIIAAIVVVSLTIFVNKPASPPATLNNSGSGIAVVNTGKGDVNFSPGYTISQHEQKLKAAITKETRYLAQIHRGKITAAKLEKQLAEQKVAELQNQLTHLADSHQKRIKQLQSINGALRTQANKIDQNMLTQATTALATGDTRVAERLFKQIEDNAQSATLAAAAAAFERGKIAHANLDYYKAYKHFKRAVGYSPDNANYLNEAAMMAGIVADYQQQIQWNEQALVLYIEQKGENSIQVATVRNNLGLTYQSLGQYLKAIEHYQLALVADIKTYGEFHPDVAIDHNNLGLAYKSLGQYQKAIEYYQLALTSDLKTYGETHPQVATYHNNLGSAYKSLGQYQKAIEYYQLALASDLKTYGEAHPNVATDRNNLGSAYKSLGQYQKAIEYYQLALTSGIQTYGETHPKVALRRSNLGSVYKALGQYQKAIEYYQLALTSGIQTYGEIHPKVALRRNHLGSAYHSLGQYQKAIEYYQQALAIFENTFDAKHRYIIKTKKNLASAQAALVKNL